jgi:hypothetical protein
MRLVVFSSWLLCLLALRADGQEAAERAADDAPDDVLTSEEWEQVDSAVERALVWLASQQQVDGSFPTLDTGQPGVTSLCVLAFMGHGHNPGEGNYGGQLERAVRFIMSCPKENGLIILHGPDGPSINRNIIHEIGYTGAYNHGIASLTLAEVYGSGYMQRSSRIQTIIDKSLSATLQMQRWPKDRPADRGGWRYINDSGEDDSDLSVTGWYLMFLRSARNAGFNVPKQSIDDAVSYIRRTFSSQHGTFGYTVGRGHEASRGMAGAGILALGHAGFHNSAEARQAGQWLLQHDFEIYNQSYHLPRDRYHYSLFNCCQGMYQLGSPYWDEFFPRTVNVLLRNQQADGSWDAQSSDGDRAFGNSYSTAMVVLSLGAPNQLLPIFQR